MSFLPRQSFPSLPSLPRSYFLGHHHAGLQKMKSLLSSIDLVIECRDYRVPLTSRNPLFEKALEGKERVICYTKRDLGGGNRDGRREEIVRGWYEGSRTKVVFVRNGKDDDAGKDGNGGGGTSSSKKSISKVLDVLRDHAQSHYKLVGHRVLVVGMPNVGKSTLLNALRAQGLNKGKVAKTGAQPGVTRKVGSGVKIIPSEDDNEPNSSPSTTTGGSVKKSMKGVGGGVYLLDTPGIFIPYIPSSTSMLKLSLCGSVKDTIIPPILLADYLLYHLNLHSPSLYSEYSSPTNDIMELLTAIAEKTGRLAKGGKIDAEATSLWLIQRWRQGGMGRFGLDEVDEDAERRAREEESAEMGVGAVSWNQARKAERERRRERNKARGEK